LCVSVCVSQCLCLSLTVYVYLSVCVSLRVCGRLYKPHLVKQVEDNNGQVIDIIEPEIINDNFIATSNIEAVRVGLRRAVTSGSAVAMTTIPISSAGKTGTAQWSSKNLPHAWFTSFAPYNDPEIVVTVLIEEGGEGSQVALPVARQIIDWWSQNRRNI